MSDSFATRGTLDVDGRHYTIFSLARLGQRFDLGHLPYSLKILLENLLRCEDGGQTVGPDPVLVEALHLGHMGCGHDRRRDREYAGHQTQ